MLVDSGQFAGKLHLYRALNYDVPSHEGAQA
jgi:hypothetical protein